MTDPMVASNTDLMTNSKSYLLTIPMTDTIIEPTSVPMTEQNFQTVSHSCDVCLFVFVFGVTCWCVRSNGRQQGLVELGSVVAREQEQNVLAENLQNLEAR